MGDSGIESIQIHFNSLYANSYNNGLTSDSPEKKSSTLCTTKSSTLYYFLADPGCVLQM